MPKGGTFTIEAANVTLDREDTDTVAEVEPGAYIMWRITDI